MSEFNVGFVIFPGITQLDFTGPLEVLSRLGTPPSISVLSKFPQSRTHVIAPAGPAWWKPSPKSTRSPSFVSRAGAQST